MLIELVVAVVGGDVMLVGFGPSAQELVDMRDPAIGVAGGADGSSEVGTVGQVDAVNDLV